MFRMMNEYMRQIKLTVDKKLVDRLNESLASCDEIERFCVTINFNRYIVDIKLKEYSIDNAHINFQSMVNEIKYAYSDMSVRYNEGKVVRYRYASCKEDKTGYYMDIVYS